MKDLASEKLAADRVEAYEQQIKTVHDSIARIDGGMRHFEAIGAEMMRDVTDKYRNDCVTRLAVLRDAQDMWKRELARSQRGA